MVPGSFPGIDADVEWRSLEIFHDELGGADTYPAGSAAG
jgi:hypothetical protein